jgi:hypothetical protein
MKSKANFGVCRLCDQQKVLRESHFLPRSIYKGLRTPGHKNQNPVVFTAQRAWATQTQMKVYLLCHDCEQLFSRNGESWALANCDRGTKGFPLRRAVDSVQPVFALPSVKLVPTASLPSVQMDALAYFAVSVVWRSGVHQWNLDQHNVKPIDVREDHLDSMKQYLLGRTGFPRDTYLWVSVAERSLPPGMNFAVPPYGGFEKTHYSWRFLIPGMQFAVFMGPLVQPQLIYRFCSVGSVDRVLHVSGFIEQELWRTAARFYETCIPDNNLQ